MREISDEIVHFDPGTLERIPVPAEPLLESFRAERNRRAERVVRALPRCADGTLDPAAVDELLVTAHCEMQRLSEEFQHGRRMEALLRPLLEGLRAAGVAEKIRVVDIGCGTGFVVRWLAASGGLRDVADVIGVDFNPALIEEAKRLAAAEHLDCDFRVANAFRLEPHAHVYISTGFVHHFRGDALSALFAQHDQEATAAMLHVDFQPSPFSGVGAWLFHFLRMRQPLCRHDGVVSALRAYTGRELVEAARSNGFDVTLLDRRLWKTPLPRVFHSLVGVRPRYREAFTNALGGRTWRIDQWTS